MKRFALILTLALAWLAQPFAHAGQPLTDGGGVTLVQLNVAGPVFGDVIPGVNGTNYIFPLPGYLDKWQQANIRVVRLSLMWERLQGKANAPFSEDYAKNVDKFLAQAAARNMGVIIDIHNYGLYYKKLVGSRDVPITVYKDLMKKVAQRWGSHPGLHGYDLMNEPHDGADAYWRDVAQTGINAVRMYDRIHPIYVEGRSWSSTVHFARLNNDLLLLNDPSNNLIFSAHLYLDPDYSGNYVAPISGTFDPMIGVKRATDFVEWLKRNNRRGQIGEFGIPDNDPRWLTAMDNLLSYLHANCVPLAYWAAGPWWGPDKLAIEPINGVARPQWPTLAKWINTSNSCK